MTFNEYNKKMNDYAERLKELSGDEYEKLYEDMSMFQSEYMTNVLIEYSRTIDCKAKEYIYNLMFHAIKISSSGNSIIDVESKEIADEIDDIIWKEIGDYLLDYEVYEEDDHWVIDCMFAGNYIPYWDGWE